MSSSRDTNDMPVGSVMIKGSIAAASVVVALVATLSTLIVTVSHSLGITDGALNSLGGVAVAATTLAGWFAIRPERTPPADATPEVSLRRWIHTTGAVFLQITGAAVWLTAGGPWPPALAALCIGSGLLATRPLPPARRQVVDLREPRTVALVPGLETPEELAALAEQAELAVSAEEQRRLAAHREGREVSSTEHGPIVLTSRQLLP